MQSRIVQPTSILMIDLDIVVDSYWLEVYRQLVRLVLSHFGLVPNTIRITPSKNRGYHVRVYLSKPVPAYMANLLQWSLLDDHGRVDFNRARINAGYDGWNKMFEPAEWHLRRHYGSCMNSKNAKTKNTKEK